MWGVIMGEGAGEWDWEVVRKGLLSKIYNTSCHTPCISWKQLCKENSSTLYLENNINKVVWSGPRPLPVCTSSQ